MPASSMSSTRPSPGAGPEVVGSEVVGSEVAGSEAAGSEVAGPVGVAGSEAAEAEPGVAAGAARGQAAKGKAPRRSRRGRATGPSIPLGSLTQREHRAVIHCQACGSTRVTRLSMNLTDGTPVEFTSCHRCEHRTWETAGDTLSVGTVLDRTRRD